MRRSIRRALNVESLTVECRPMILVTGASGFVGNHVARALLRRGQPLRLLVRETSNLSYLKDCGGFETVEGDLRDRASLERAVAGCEILFHVAADYRFDVADPVDTYKSNVEGTGIFLPMPIVLRLLLYHDLAK